MKFAITFEGNTPSKKNGKRFALSKKTGRRFLLSSKDHEEWHRNALWTVKQQMACLRPIFPLPSSEGITAVIYFGDYRRRDLSNVWESIADLLVDAGVLKDDDWQATGPVHLIPAFRKGAPGWEAHITPPKGIA